MELKPTDQWKRQQLANIERIQADLSVYTRHVTNITTIACFCYLFTWLQLSLLGDDAQKYEGTTLLLVLSGTLVLLMLPVCVLVGVNALYFRRRLK